MERRDNYAIQLAQAKQRFLTYDQQELIQRCRLQYDSQYLYTKMLSQDYRVCRKTGDMERYCGGNWVDGNSFAEVLTLLDWLCDSRHDRYITGRWVNMVSLSHNFHRNLQEDTPDADALFFDSHPDAFQKACTALKGEPASGADMGYVIELVDGLSILVQLWRGDEEFPPRLRFLWDENTNRYIRYETTWYALGLLMRRLKERI